MLTREEKRKRELVSFRCGGREFQRMVEGIKYFLKEDIFECRQIKYYLDERSGVDKMMRDGKAGRFEVGRRSSCERA